MSKSACERSARSHAEAARKGVAQKEYRGEDYPDVCGGETEGSDKLAFKKDMAGRCFVPVRPPIELDLW